MSFRISFYVRINYGEALILGPPHASQILATAIPVLRLCCLLPGSTFDDGEELMRGQYSWTKKNTVLHYYTSCEIDYTSQRTKQKTPITYIYRWNVKW